MTGQFVRVSARVPLAQAEEARAAALELAPGGFEESETGDDARPRLYVDESAVEAIRAAFADVEVTPVEPAGRTPGARSTGPPARAGSGSGRRGSSPTPASPPS